MNAIQRKFITDKNISYHNFGTIKHGRKIVSDFYEIRCKPETLTYIQENYPKCVVSVKAYLYAPEIKNIIVEFKR